MFQYSINTRPDYFLSSQRERSLFGRTIADADSVGNLYAFPTNFTKDEEYYLLEIAVPGLSKNDLRIHLQDGVLWVSGERKTKTVTTDFTEFNSTHFSRSFVLPDDAHENSVKATCRHGLLTMKIPRKRMMNRPRRIPVNVKADCQDSRLSQLLRNWRTRFVNWCTRLSLNPATRPKFGLPGSP